MSDGWHYFQKLSAACCYEWNEIGEVLRRLIRNAAITMHVDWNGSTLEQCMCVQYVPAYVRCVVQTLVLNIPWALLSRTRRSRSHI